MKYNIQSRLQKLQPTSFPTVITMDMGVQFLLVTTKGYYEDLGSFGSWPLHHFNGIDKNLDKIKEKISNKALSPEDLRETSIESLYCLIKEHDESTESPTDINNFFSGLLDFHCDCINDLYVFCDFSVVKLKALFFTNYQDLEVYFLNQYPVYPWDSLSNEDIESYLEQIDDQSGLQLNEYPLTGTGEL